MFKQKKKKSSLSLKELIYEIPELYDYQILDSENIIVETLISDEPLASNNRYTITHYKYDQEHLQEIKTWKLKKGVCSLQIHIFHEYQILTINDKNGNIDEVYNYKEGREIIPSGIWTKIMITNDRGNNGHIIPTVNYLKEYGALIGQLEIKSEILENESEYFTWENPYTHERFTQDFDEKETYFAIINLDGSIRENKLFQGNTFSQIEQIIDLNNYDSLASFVQKKRKELTRQKALKNQTSLPEVFSPYLDKEVHSVLKRSKKK